MGEFTPAVGARARPVPGPTPLTPAEVHQVIASRADRPLSTPEVTDMCQAAHPGYANVCNYRVGNLLRYLRKRNRVTSLHGSTDRDRLENLGVTHPHGQLLYWSTPERLTSEAFPLADQAIYDDLPIADDGREPFLVTHEWLDAPQGAVLELTDSGHPGWWQRRNTEWVPVARPARQDT